MNATVMTKQQIERRLAAERKAQATKDFVTKHTGTGVRAATEGAAVAVTFLKTLFK